MLAGPIRRAGRTAPRPGVGLARGAGPEVREELVDHRRLGDERDDAQRAVAGRTRERVDLKYQPQRAERPCPRR